MIVVVIYLNRFSQSAWSKKASQASAGNCGGHGERKSGELHALLLYCFTSLPRPPKTENRGRGPSDTKTLIEFQRDRREAVFLFRSARFANVCFWHLADNLAAPAFVRIWGTADNGEFWPAMVCPLMTLSGQIAE
jgi:hypothetical protein